MFSVLIGFIWLKAGLGTALGQVPTAAIQGSVRDSSGGVIVGASVTVRHPGTGLTRQGTTEADGDFRIAALQPGTYEIAASSPRLETSRRRVTLLVGDNLTVNFQLQVAGYQQSVEVQSDVSGVNTTEFKVDGRVSRVEIENLPLNGRSFLELAQLEPGIQVVSLTNPGVLGNNYQQVLVGGAYYSQTRISIDGSTVGDRFVGGTTQGLSQESVQEFQASTFNLDLATGLTGSGAINIVSRRGSNDLHGSGFFYYRDQNLAAYPGLRRSAFNPEPSFARRQSGFNLGGPLRHDRLFWFANYEHNNQDAVFAITNNHPIFSKFDLIHPNPLDSDQFNLRIDGQASDRHQAFVRFSFDKNDTVAPAGAVGMPSNWQSVRNRAFQLQGGVTSVVTPRLVNDLRYSHSYLGGDIDPVSPSQCNDPVACVGVGGANITVFDAPQFRIGNQFNSPFGRWVRTYELIDNVSWQHGPHRVRFGGEWEHLYLKASLAFQEPAAVTLWGPSNLQTPALSPLYDALPVSLKDPSAPPPTLSEILQLPLRSFTTGIGNPSLPGPYDFDRSSRNDRGRFYFQDAWHALPSLTVSYGLAYSYETTLFHHDLDYPSYLAPLVGGDLRPPRRDTNNFDPSFGLAWTPGKGGLTVIRAGGGIYRDEANLAWKARDRAFIGPSGNGRVVVDGSVAGLSFTSTPTGFSGADLMPVLPGLRSGLAARFGDGSDLSVRGIEVIKQGDQIVAPDSTTAYSIHLNAGIQRELRPNLVLTADYVMRRYLHVGALQGVFSIDRNRFNRPRVTGVDQNTGVVSFVRDPVIPLCSLVQANAFDPKDNCSTGPINIFASGANYRYQGLHLKVEKRYSAGLQFTLGYALARNTGFIYENGFTDYDDYRLSYGNISGHRQHRLTVSGIWTPSAYRGDSRLWRGLLNSWTVSLISQAYSAPPLNTLLNGLDLDGDGISLTLLPGTTQQNSLGEGLSAPQLRELITQYNADVEARTRRVTNPDGSVTVVRPRTPFNQIINPIGLPETFSNGDSFLTQDVRLTRGVKISERVRLSLIGEVFNLFNIANLTGFSGVLNQPNYGLPSARAAQVFGTGGPRAIQFAARVVF
ncbi:MAG TPA: carboxypeptidase regulatory-like domain-containing protein [Terriglobia bacterium]|nr:carboxypeptidase regulatory-like domain-containing protein [Terriglobia bacterium]